MDQLWVVGMIKRTLEVAIHMSDRETRDPSLVEVIQKASKMVDVFKQHRP